MTWCDIIIGDARKVLNDIPDNCIDLIITSPPYFALKKYPDHPMSINTKSIKSYLNGLKEVFQKCYKILKNGRFICVVVGQYTSMDESYFIPGYVARILEDIGFNYRREHIWVKPKGTQGIWNRGTTIFLKEPYPRNTMINIQHEHILIFQKGNKKDIRKTESLSESEVKKFCWSIWEIPVSEIKEHPAPFPEELPKRLIKMYSYKNEVILDPFLGSGTTLKAAIKLERNSVGIEVNSKYLPLIEKVLDIKQKKLVKDVDFKIIRYDKGERYQFTTRLGELFV